MASWDQVADQAKKQAEEGGIFLKLANDGDSVVGVILGDPYPRNVCYVDGKTVLFTDELKAQGQKGTLRVSLNVAVYESREVKIIEQGSRFFQDVVKLRAKYGLDKWAFEITRNGVAKDPKTTYSILPDRQLTAEEQRIFQTLPLHDFAARYEETPAKRAEAALAASPRVVPIDSEIAQVIASDLKLLPREAADRFCKEFGVYRIRDLTNAHVSAAIAYVAALTKEYAPQEADPFA